MLRKVQRPDASVYNPENTDRMHFYNLIKINLKSLINTYGTSSNPFLS